MRCFRTWAELIALLAIGAELSVAAGQDVSWDLRNYHLYNAAVVLQGRQGLDFFAADKHSGLNPLLDFIYAWLALGPLADDPRLLAGVMGCWYGLLAFVALRLMRLLFAPFAVGERRILVGLGTLTAVTGAMTVSQIGTSSNDIAVAMLVLAGLVCVMRSGRDRRWLLAGGLLAGVAAGAKLTAAVYMPGLVAGLVAALPRMNMFLYQLPIKTNPAIASPHVLSFRNPGSSPGLKIFFSALRSKDERQIYAESDLLSSCDGMNQLDRRLVLQACGWFCGGWAAGFAAAFGWWGWGLWRRFGNPFFPMLNDVFRSPLAPPLGLRDMRFFPHDGWQWIFYPFDWAWDSGIHTVYEEPFRDPRLAFAYVALAVWGTTALWRRRMDAPALAANAPQKICVWFLVCGYVAWLTTSSILRYAIVLEVVSVPVTLVAVMRLADGLRARWRHVPLALACAVCVLSLATTTHPDWGHRPFRDRVFAVDLGWVPDNAMFLGVYEPVAYLAALIPPEKKARFVGLGFVSYLHGWPLGDTGEAMIRAHRGPVYVLLRDERRGFLSLLPSVGLSAEVKNCRVVETNITPVGDPAVLVCETSRI